MHAAILPTQHRVPSKLHFNKQPNPKKLNQHTQVSQVKRGMKHIKNNIKLKYLTLFF